MLKTKRIISFALVCMILISAFSMLTLSSSAVSKYTHYTARKGSSYTFRVTTTGKWYQGNATIKFHSAAEVQNIGMKAPTMVLTIRDHSTNKTTVKWISGSGDDYYSTLSLAKNRTYTITVSYLNNWSKNATMAAGTGKSWTYGYWEITSTNRVSFK